MVYKGKNYFPLTLVLHIIATGYYMDSDGEVWSERARKGVLTKLTGSTTATGRYVTLQSSSRSRFGSTYNLAQLQKLCREHIEWKILGMDVVQVPKTDLATAMGLKSTAGRLGTMHAQSAVARHVQRQAEDAATIANLVAAGKRHHAADVNSGIKARGWVIGAVEDGALTFGLKPAIHTTEQSVNDEIDRLAKLRPGKKFVKLQIQGAVTVGAVVWE